MDTRATLNSFSFGDKATASTIDTNEPDDNYPPEVFQSPQSPSAESSLIFERSVEDPCQIYQQTGCPRCQKPQGQCHHASTSLPSHYSVENFVSPCLDATTELLTDKNADLENVDMVYSRRPSSVLGLNLALGRSRTASDAQDFSPPKLEAKTQSFANFQDLNQGNTKRHPALSFYSYADMIESENPNPRRPSLSQSLSSSLLKSRSNSVNTSTLNMGTGASTIAPQRTPISRRAPSFNSKPKHQPFMLSDNSPGSSDSESDYMHSRKNSVTSRISNRLKKTLSGASSVSRNSVVSDGDSLVISSVGETLRKHNSEIKSGVLA